MPFAKSLPLFLIGASSLLHSAQAGYQAEWGGSFGGGRRNLRAQEEALEAIQGHRRLTCWIITSCECYEEGSLELGPPETVWPNVYATLAECECLGCGRGDGCDDHCTSSCAFPPATNVPPAFCVPGDPCVGVDPGSLSCPALPPPPPPPPTAGMVTDPHLKSWSGKWFDYMGACDLRLMFVPNFDEQSQDMTIDVRTTIRYDYSFIEAAALKIGQDVLEVTSFGGYALNGVEGALGPNGNSVPTVGGYPVYYRQVNKKKSVFDVVVGTGKNITLSTWKDWVSVEVYGGDRSAFGEVTGLMGTIDGKMLARDGTDLENDINALGQDWQVQPGEEMLFRTVRHPQAPELCVLPSEDQTKEARRLNEGKIPRDDAEAACAHLNGHARAFCVTDVMASGDLDAAQSGAF